MNSSDEPNKPRFRLTEGILLALAPAFSYLLAFYYERGFAQYFNIPMKFIHVGLIEILILATIVFAIVVLLLALLNSLNLVFFLNFRFEKIHPIIQSRFLGLLPAVVVFIIFFALFGSKWQYWIPWLIFCIGMAFAYFLLPLFTQRKVSGYTNKLIAQTEFDENNPGIYTAIGLRYGWALILSIGVIILAPIIAQNIGLAEALNQREFLVPDSSPEMVVLRIYGDKLIAAPFDRNTREVESKFVIKILGQDDKLVIGPEDIGPLKPNRPSPTPTFTPTPSPTATVTPIPTSTNTPVP